MRTWTLCPCNQWSRASNWEAFRMVGRGCVRICITSNSGEFQCALRNFSLVPNTSSILLSVSRCTDWGKSSSFKNKNNCRKLQKETGIKVMEESKLFQSSRWVPTHEYWPCKEVAQMMGPFEWSGCSQERTTDSGEFKDVCNVWALAKITKIIVLICHAARIRNLVERRGENRCLRAYAMYNA